ncbi:hypothetical protein GGR52DRAFT_191033 [Hypoxylon sp. FL1284]|nr:hypothetical protein GGR52DRAFT_191033 [Hypoxylon sp. FL1284]
MSNSSSSDSSDNVGNTGMDSATLAGVISTVITFAALIVSSIQLLYQYYTNVSLNALGARNCNERVMGPWARATRRRFRWLELRFEIIFESPVLFVAPAFNKRGPVVGQPIWYIDGSEQSHQVTRTAPIDSRDAAMSPRTTGVRQSVNVEATWVMLLQNLQFMESESKTWHDRVSRNNIGVPRVDPDAYFAGRTLAVGVQAQTLSWDFVPNFKKPFATSNISHIVEIAAMLGIHWTMWDPAADRYRAEGNGFVLLGSFVADQGIVFQLIKHDRTTFGENRLIPSNDIKRLCFGFAPTLYKPDEMAIAYGKETDKVLYTDPILPLLRLGSRQEIMETLTDIGLPIHISEYFLSEDARVSHLFPVVFDVLGMLGRSISVEGCSYRMLPNPTVFRYDRRRFQTQRLLLEFKARFDSMVREPGLDKWAWEAIGAIQSSLQRLYPYLQDPSVDDYSPVLLDTLRSIVETLDFHLKDPVSEGILSETAVLEAEHNHVETTVLNVVRDHMACIVADLRRRPSRLVDKVPLGGRNDDGARERGYVRFLFDRCRYATVHRFRSFDALHESLDHYVTLPGWLTSPEMSSMGRIDSDDDEDEDDGSDSWWKPHARRREITWCLLVFRMLCWLQLHDFHRDDVMIPRNATFGSRMPVYII